MHTYSVQIEPIDPLLFGDNRSARAGEDHALADQDPSPAALYGAIGGRIARALGATGEATWAKAQEVLGPFEPRLDRPGKDRSALLGYTFRDVDGRLWFPRPLHFRVERTGDRFTGLEPLHPTAPAAGEVGSQRLPWRLVSPPPPSGKPFAKEAEEDLWASEELLAEILTASAGAQSSLEHRLLPASGFYLPERRAGLAMDNDRGTAAERRLFARPYRRFRSGLSAARGAWGTAGYTAWFSVPADAPPAAGKWEGVGFLGGDRRRVRLSFAPLDSRPLADLLDQVLSAVGESEGFLVYLLTPAVAGGEGPRIGGREPVAVALGRPATVSGWGAAASRQGPRPLRTLLPAGSVFFYTWDEEADLGARRDLLREHWLTPVSEAFRNPGFGRLLLGVWR